MLDSQPVPPVGLSGVSALRDRLGQSEWIVCAEARRILGDSDESIQEMAETLLEFRTALKTIAERDWQPDPEMSPGNEWLPALNTVVEIAKEALYG